MALQVCQLIEDVFGHCLAFQNDAGDVAAGFLFFGDQDPNVSKFNL
jgi:hypothetical protein